MKRFFRFVSGFLVISLLVGCSGYSENKKNSDIHKKESDNLQPSKKETENLYAETLVPNDNVNLNDEEIDYKIPDNAISMDGVSATLPPEYDLEYSKSVINSDGALDEEFYESIVQINWWVGNTICPITDSDTVKKFINCLKSSKYIEMSDYERRDGSIAIDYVTEKGVVRTHMQTDILKVAKKAYSIDSNLLTELREIVEDYFGWN